MQGLILGILRYLHVPYSRLPSFAWRGSNPRKYRGQSSFQVIFASLCFYYITHSEREESIYLCMYTGWVTLTCFPSSLLYRVEPPLLHLKVMDGKFKERPFCPIRRVEFPVP